MNRDEFKDKLGKTEDMADGEILKVIEEYWELLKSKDEALPKVNTIEELSELTVELTKAIKRDTSRVSLDTLEEQNTDALEEMADVMISLIILQHDLKIPSRLFRKAIEVKVQRLADRVNQRKQLKETIKGFREQLRNQK